MPRRRPRGCRAAGPTGVECGTMSGCTRLLALLVLFVALPAAGQKEDLVERGRQTYEVYCWNCHGETGRGNGPMAEMLTVRPTDLRLLSASNEGEFPFDRLYRVIDGREEVAGHGDREMPIWGMTFQERGLDRNQEDEVRGRILQLILYLRSIQIEKPDQAPAEGRERHDSKREGERKEKAGAGDR